MLGVDTEEFHQFDYDYNARLTYAFIGPVDQHLSTEFQCWEKDDSPGSFYDGLRAALAASPSGPSTLLHDRGW
ncbi:hypothetical protein [Streptomyces flavidovirens]|uniref:hypothetical protein n=1 Tax=Streptomyces flavidovirens TaxID=67298 RepID=UPI00368AD2A1